jgi:lipoate-protein ligase A
MMTEYLLSPPRQPEYRCGRSHREFVENLPVTAAQLRSCVPRGWHAHEPLLEWPDALTQRLVSQRYGLDEWNLAR